MVALDHSFAYLTRVFGQMEAIRSLDSVRRAQADRTAVIGRAITRDQFNTWMVVYPGCSSLGSSVGKEIDNGMTLAVGEHGAEDLAFAKGNVIATEHARRWNGGGGSGMSASKQGVTARRHGTSSALASSSFTTTCQSQVTERLMQANRSASGGGDERRQALGEGDGRARVMKAAKAPDMKEETNWYPTHRQINGLARGVAMNVGRGKFARRAGRGRGKSHCGEQHAIRRLLDFCNGHAGDECGEKVGARGIENTCTHPYSIADTSAVCLSTVVAEEPIFRDAMRGKEQSVA